MKTSGKIDKKSSLFSFVVWLLVSLSMLSLGSCKTTSPAPDVAKDEAKEAKAATPGSGELGLTMQGLKDTLTALDPYLVDEKKFLDPANETLINGQIQRMSEISKKVVHNPVVESQDPTLRYVAGQFNQDLQRSAESFSLGRKDFARYQLLKVTSYCIECHTRTAQGPQFESPIDNKNILHLDRVSRAEYYISTRYFDQALKLLEDELNDRAPKNSVQLDKLARYGFLITVQYQQNPDRAIEFVDKVAKQKDLPLDISKKIKGWRQDLQAWKEEKSNGTPHDMDFYLRLSKNHESEVSQMRVLSGLLARVAHPPTSGELGESLFLIGQSYAYLSEITPIPLQENYYESCIRSAPHTDWAKKCYKGLQNEINFGYSGSGGTHIPADVQEHMDRLHELL